MALTIKNTAVEKLAAEVALMTHESKTEAIRVALEERKFRLISPELAAERYKALHHFLETEIWPNIPPDMLGTPVSQAEQDEILGYGPNGYCD